MKGMIVTPHRDGCLAVAAVESGQWPHGNPWANGSYTWLEREKTGRPHAGLSVAFLRYPCNDAACPAEVIFLAELLERELGLRLPTDSKRERELDEFWQGERDVGWEHHA